MIYGRIGSSVNIINSIQQIAEMKKHENASTNFFRQQKLIMIRYSYELNSLHIPRLLMLILIVIESLQLISMGFVFPLKFKSVGLQQFRNLSNVLYPDFYLRNYRPLEYSVLAFFLLTFTHCALNAIAYRKFVKKQKSRLFVIIHVLFVMHNSVLVAPSSLINLAALTCNSSSSYHSQQNHTCYSGYHIFICALAAVNLLWMLISTIFLYFFYNNRNPFYFGFFTTSSNIWIFGKLAVKLGPAIFLIVDGALNFDVLYIVIVGALNSGYFIAFRFMWPYFRNWKSVENLLVKSEIMVASVTISLIPLHFLQDLDEYNLIFIYSWVLGLTFGQYLSTAQKWKKQKILNLFVRGKFENQSKQKYEQFFYSFIEDTELKLIDKKQVQIFDLLKIHQCRCENANANASLECICIPLMNIFKSRNLSVITQTQLYQFILLMITEVSSAIKNNLGLIVLAGYVEYFKLNSKVKSVGHLAKEINPKIEHFQIVAIQSLFYEFSTHSTEVTDLLKYKELTEKLLELQKQAEELAIFYSRYWRELIQQDCEITKLWRLAKHIDLIKKRIDRTVQQELLPLSPNNVQTLKIRLQLLKLVIHAQKKQIQELETSHCQTVIRECQKFKVDDKVEFRENSDTAVMCVSQREEGFYFTKISSNIINVLKIKNSLLIERNINQILLEPYHDEHDEKIKAYLQKSDEQISLRESTVYLVDGNKKIVKCRYATKILPSLETGFEFVCFIRKIKAKERVKVHHLIYWMGSASAKDQNKENRAGEIIAIDEQLQVLFFGKKKEEFKADYKYSLAEMLPEWDIYLQVLRDCSEHSANSDLFESIQVIKTDKLSPSTIIKTMRFTYKNVESLLLRYNNSTKYFSQIVREKMGKSDHIIDISDEESSETIAGPSNLMLIPESSTNFTRIPRKFSHLQISAFILLFVSLLSILSGITYTLSEAPYNGQFNDIQILHYSELNQKDVLVSAISIYNIEAKIEVANVQPLLKQVEKNTRNIYRILTLQVIDQHISLLLSHQTEASLNNGVSLWKTAGEDYLNRKTKESYSFILENTVTIYKEHKKLYPLSQSINLFQQQRTFTNLYIVDSLSILLIIIFSILVLIRLKTVSDFTHEIVEFYEKFLKIPAIEEYENDCENFIFKINNNKNFQYNRELKNCYPEWFYDAKIVEENRDTFNIKKDVLELSRPQVRMEEQALLQIKNKVTFQEVPSMNRMLIILAAILMILAVLRYISAKEWDVRSRISQFSDAKAVLDQVASVNVELSLILFYFRTQNANLLNETVESVEFLCRNLRLFPESVNIEILYRTLSYLRSGLNVSDYNSYLFVEQKVMEFQKSLTTFQNHRIRELTAQKQGYITDVRLYELISTLIIWVLAFGAIGKCVIREMEESMEGCWLMLNMVKKMDALQNK